MNGRTYALTHVELENSTSHNNTLRAPTGCGGIILQTATSWIISLLFSLSTHWNAIGYKKSPSLLRCILLCRSVRRFKCVWLTSATSLCATIADGTHRSSPENATWHFISRPRSLFFVNRYWLSTFSTVGGLPPRSKTAHCIHAVSVLSHFAVVRWWMFTSIPPSYCGRMDFRFRSFSFLLLIVPL